MNSITRECNYCDDRRQIKMYKPSPTDKWVVTNLDGSRHTHNQQQQASIIPQQQEQEQEQEQEQQQHTQMHPLSQHEQIKAMAEAKNEVAKDTNKALLALAEAIKELADALKGKPTA